MKIVCKLKREGGSHVEIGKEKYHFQADKDGDHVAEVKDPKHIAILLNIPEAYHEKGGEKEQAPAMTPEQEEAAALFPLADLDLEKLTNKELMTAAKDHLGITGTNKENLANWAKEKLQVNDLATRDPKATYVALLRDVLTSVQKIQREEKQAYLLESSQDEENGGD